jgi:hypothetical protein
LEAFWKRLVGMIVPVAIKAAFLEKQYVETSRSNLSIFSGALLADTGGGNR